MRDVRSRRERRRRRVIQPSTARRTALSTELRTDFEWDHAGSADLALAILADYFDEPAELVLASASGGSIWTRRSKAAALHQLFEVQFVASEHRDGWRLHSDAIEAWFQTPRIRKRLESWPKKEEEMAEIHRLDEEAERDAEAAD